MNETSSATLAKLASRAMRDPGSITLNEIRSLAACVLNQARDRVESPKVAGAGTEVHVPYVDPVVAPPHPEAGAETNESPPEPLPKSMLLRWIQLLYHSRN